MHWDISHTVLHSLENTLTCNTLHLTHCIDRNKTNYARKTTLRNTYQLIACFVIFTIFCTGLYFICSTFPRLSLCNGSIKVYQHYAATSKCPHSAPWRHLVCDRLTLHSIYFIQYTSLNVKSSIYCTQCTLYNLPHSSIYNLQYNALNVHYTIYCTQCTILDILHSMYIVQSTALNVYYTIYCTLCTINIFWTQCTIVFKCY